MDKDKFVEWLEKKIKRLGSECIETEDATAKAFMQGSVITMIEIKDRIEDGKFDL